MTMDSVVHVEDEDALKSTPGLQKRDLVNNTETNTATSEPEKIIEQSTVEEVMNEHKTEEEVIDGGNDKDKDKVMNDEHTKEEANKEGFINKETDKWMTKDNVEGDLCSTSEPKKTKMVDNVDTEMAASEPMKNEQKVSEESTQRDVMNAEHLDKELINDKNAKYAVISKEDAQKEVNAEEIKVKSNRKIKINKASKTSIKKALTVTNKKVELINAENTKEEVNNKEVEIKSTEKIEKPSRRRRKKALMHTDEAVSKDAGKLEVRHEEHKKEVLINADNTKEEVKNEQVELRSTEKVGMSKRSRKRTSRDMDEVVANDRDKLNSSKKKAKTKADTAGMIFMCSSKTKKDCYKYNILGLPASKKDLVLKIYKGMTLFLFDFDLRLMYGIYKAARPGGYDIERKAFKSLFPSQVRFTVKEDCMPLAEERFREVIKDNYYAKNKFDCQLSSEQVENLCKLFRVASKGPKSEPSSRRSRADTGKRDRSARPETRKHSKSIQETRAFVDQHRSRQQGWDRERLPAFRSEHPYREDRLGSDRLYREDHLRPDCLYRQDRLVYGREAFVPPVVPLHPESALAPPPSYAPGRRLEDEYRWAVRAEDEHLARNIHRPLYHDPLYSAGMPSRYQPISSQITQHYPPADRLTEYYPTSTSQVSEYHPLQSLYRL